MSNAQASSSSNNPDNPNNTTTPPPHPLPQSIIDSALYINDGPALADPTYELRRFSYFPVLTFPYHTSSLLKSIMLTPRGAIRLVARINTRGIIATSGLGTGVALAAMAPPPPSSSSSPSTPTPPMTAAETGAMAAASTATQLRAEMWTRLVGQDWSQFRPGMVVGAQGNHHARLFLESRVELAQREVGRSGLFRREVQEALDRLVLEAEPMVRGDWFIEAGEPVAAAAMAAEQEGHSAGVGDQDADGEVDEGGGVVDESVFDGATGSHGRRGRWNFR